MSNWLDLSSTSNRYIRMYVQGFVDISGGNLIVRNNDVSFNNRLFVGSDTTVNKRLFAGGDASLNSNLYVSGNVGIGITNPSYKLEVNGTVRFGNNVSNNKLLVLYDASTNETLSSGTNFYGFGINSGTLRYQTDTTGGSHKFYCGTTLAANIANTGITSLTYNATSDYRIKANIIPLSDTSFTVDLLRPVTYMNTSLGKSDIGFIAHEVQEQFPFLVTGEKDAEEHQTLNYTGLIGLLTKEIQDLKKDIKEIRRELASYKQ